MKMNKNLGTILLSAWLILTGIMQLVEIPIPSMIMAILAIAAGALLLFGSKIKI